jgi:hypothetical protein
MPQDIVALSAAPIANLRSYSLLQVSAEAGPHLICAIVEK